MSFREGLLNIEKKWAWSFFGLLLAIIFGAFAIYTTYFEDKNPNLQFIAETRTQVLDLKEDIKNLDILYKGINIKEQDQNLSVLTLKVINNSNVTILKSFYDDLSPILLFVERAEIVDKPQVVETSNDYLKENLNIELDSTGRIYLPELIIEGNEYYVISLLLLHKNGTEPVIKSSGKIAGQINGIEVLENYAASAEISFRDRLISGNIWVHLVRFFFYLIVIIVLALSIFIPSALISESINENRKKKRVKNYKKKKEIENTKETDAVFDLYLKHSEEFLNNVKKVLSNERRLKAIVWRIERNEERHQREQRHMVLQNEEYLIEERISGSARRIVRHFPNDEYIVHILKDLGMVKYESKELIINEKFQKELIDFISYLKLI